jgi:putative spermidine/putrescine transport system permease protein
VASRLTRVTAWAVLGAAAVFFLVPILATVAYSLSAQRGGALAAYAAIFTDPAFWRGLGVSLAAALGTVAVGIALVLPAAYWVHLRLTWLMPWLEVASLMSFVVPPIVLVFGVVRFYSNAPWPLSLRAVMLVGTYTVMSLPYLLRSVASGLGAIHAAVLTEAAQSLGASWPRLMAAVIVPNLRGALLGGAFLTFALVMGEYAVASMLGFDNLGVYMLLTGQDEAQGAAALSVVALLLVWATVAAMQHLAAGQEAGAGGGGR